MIDTVGADAHIRPLPHPRFPRNIFVPHRRDTPPGVSARYRTIDPLRTIDFRDDVGIVPYKPVQLIP